MRGQCFFSGRASRMMAKAGWVLVVWCLATAGFAQAGQTGKLAQAGRSAQTGKATQSSKSAQPGKPAQQARKPGQARKPAQQARKPGQARKPAQQARKPTQARKPAQAGRPTQSRKVPPISRGILTGDAAIHAAKAAYDARDLAAFDRLNPSGHVLSLYVEYWRLLVALGSKPMGEIESEVQSFLKQAAGTPLEPLMQRAWLKTLAEVQDWTRFAMAYPQVEEDTELVCYGIQYRIRQEGESALEAGRALWLTGKSQPNSCRQVFDMMRTSGLLTESDVRARYALAVQASNVSLARALWRSFPASQRSDERAFTRAERQPLKYLESKPTPKQRGARELLYFALERGARQDIDRTRRAWETVRHHWPKADQDYGNMRIAYHAAHRLHPDAHRLFNGAGNASLNEMQQPWRIRAALRAGDYQAALKAIEALPDARRDEEMWRYWRARCLEQQKTEAAILEAQQVYQQLAGRPTYYGFLAHEQLEARGIATSSALTTASTAAPGMPMLEAIRTFLTRDAVRRIVKLHALDFRTEMLVEWRALVSVLDDTELRMVAMAMAQQGLFDRSIAAADRMKTPEWTLSYPRPYPEAFRKAGAIYSVDENWLYAIARQESRFISDIVSSAGAIGLMQLMPATAREVAKKTGNTDYRIGHLNNPSVNTQFGAFYLRHCLDRLDGSLVLAAAAYNAGPGRAHNWRASAEAQGGAAMEGDVWIESIPFDETRDYVKKVLANAKVYAYQRNETFSLRDALTGIHSPPI